MAATNSGLSDKAVSISLADRHWLKNLPRKIFSACMKFGGNQCEDVEACRCKTDRQTDRQTDRHTHTHTHRGGFSRVLGVVSIISIFMY